MSLERVLFEYRRARRLLWERWIADSGELTRACAGCPSSFCCYQLPLCHPLEGMVAAQYLIQESRTVDIERAADQGGRQFELWSRDLDVLKHCTSLEDAQVIAGTGAEAWYRLREPCVFLKDGRCSIYLVRPTMCATYYVQDRCVRFVACDETVPTADNSMVVAAVMDLSDVAFSAVVNQDARTKAAPVPFAYAVGLGARLLAGQLVEVSGLR